MANIKDYEQVVLEVLHAEKIERGASGVQDIVIADKESRHYQLLRTGWETDAFFINKLVFHFHISDNGKIWLLSNNTDIPITDELIKRGVPVSDIVLGFHPEKYRAHSGFAAH
jgi:XisI protein